MAGFIQAQTFGDASFYDSTSTLNYNSTFQVRHSSQTKTLTWYRLQQLLGSGTTLKSSNNTWTGTNNFTSNVYLPSTLSSSSVRGIGYSSGLFSWVNDDTVRVGADRAWVLNAMDTAGIAAGASSYATISGDNTFTGTNVFSNRIALGSGSNSGELLIPQYTSTNTPTDITRMFWFNSTNNKLYVNNGGTIKAFLDSSGVVSLVQSGVSWTTSTNQTGLIGDKTASSGTWTPYKISFGSEDAGRSLIIPIDKNDILSAETGSIRLGTEGTDRLEVHNGTSWDTYSTDSDVTTEIETYINYDTPTVDSGTVAMTMTKSNIISYEVQQESNTDTDITVSGFGYGKMLSFMIKDLDVSEGGFTLTVTGATLDYGESSAPTWTDGAWYLVQLIGVSSSDCLITYTRIDK